MKNVLRPALVTSLLLTPLVALASSSATPSSPIASLPAPTLDNIKALVGDWYEVDEEGEVSETLVCTYRLTAGGSAVLQTIFPGGEEEMLTVHHQDGGDLVSTHYCVMGNQPSYIARNGEKAGDLVFECRGVANLDSEEGMHMHRGRHISEGPDRMRSIWEMIEAGETTYTADQRLVRLSNDG